MDIQLNLLNSAFFVSISLFVLFETEALIKYAQLLGLTKFLPCWVDYQEIIQTGSQVGYLKYLAAANRNFLHSLIACPACLSVWISFVVSATYNLQFFPFIEFVGLLGYFLLKIAANLSVKV